MATYGEIATRVETVLVNASPDVSAAIPRLVWEAQKEAERRHAFQAMKGIWVARTQLDSNLTVAWKGLMRNLLSARSESASYTFLRTRKENPYWVEFDAGLPSMTAVGLAVTTGPQAGDGYATWVFSAVSAASAAGLALAKIRPGMHVVVSNVSPATGLDIPWFESIPFLVKEISVEAADFGLVVWTMITWTPDASLLSGISPVVTADVEAVWDTPAEIHPMSWINERDAARIYKTQLVVDNDPVHVVDLGRDEMGQPIFQVYPKNDTTQYSVVIPSFMHLGSSLVDIPGPTETCWFTNFADIYLERKAAAEALLLESDIEKATIYATRAEEEFQRLVKQDKGEIVKSRTLRFSTNAGNS